MLERFGRIRLRWKYILTYVLVMLIPFSILLGVFLVDRIEVVQADADRIYSSYLSQCSSSVELKLTSLHSVAASVLGDDRLSWTNLASRQWEEIQARSELKSHNTLNTMPGQMYLCFRRPRLLYSASGKVGMDAFCTYVLGLDSQEAEAFEEWLYGTQSIAYWTTDCGFGSERWMLMRYAGSFSGSRDSVVLFTVPVGDLSNALAGSLGSAHPYLALVDENGNVLCTPDGLEDADILNIDAAVRSEYGECTAIEYGRWMAYVQKIRYCGYRCMVIVPQELVRVSIFSANPSMLMVAMGVLLFGLVCSIVIALAVYRPINLIYRQVAPEEQSGHELETISFSFRRLKEENRRLHEEVESQISFVVDSTADRMLHGRIDPKRGLSILRQNGVNFRWPLYLVLAVDYGDLEDDLAAVRNRVAERLTQFIGRDDSMEMLLVEPTGRRQTIALVNLEEPQLAKRLLEQLEVGWEMEFSMGVSALCDEASKISRAYNEALYCLNRADDRPRVVRWEESAVQSLQDESIEAQLARLEQNLLMNIRENNVPGCMEIMSALTAATLSDESPGARSGLVHLLSEVISFAYTLKNEDLESEIVGLFGQSPMALTEIFSNLCSLVVRLCEATERQNQVEQAQFYRDISDFVVEHFCEADFSLDTVAEKFGMSVYVASRYFCTNTGENFKDMLARMRIERVKLLMLETDRSLKEIVQSVGYLDVSSFIRKFKQSEGMTPGQWRSVNQRTEDEP